MTMHTRFARLAVASIDFRLSPAEDAALAAHLASCAVCRTISSRYRADAATLHGAGYVVSAPDRVRGSVLGAAQRSGPQRPPWQLVLVAALLAVMLAALVVAAGALRELQDGPARPIIWRPAAAGAALIDQQAVRLEQVAAGPAGFVVVAQAADDQVALFSVDGASWEAAAAFETGTVRDITYVEGGGRPGMFAAVGALDGSAVIWWSTDAREWTADPVAGAPGEVVAVGSVRTTTVAFIVHEAPPADPTIEPGADLEPTLTAWWSRIPGRWVRADIAGETVGLPRGQAALTRTDAGLAALGGSDLLLTETGDFWTSIPDIERSPQEPLLAWGLGRFVAAGHSADTAIIRTSVDGRAWSDSIVPEAGGSVIAGISFRDGLFVAVGSGPRGVMTWHSKDGEAWHAEMSVPGGSGALMTDVAWGRDALVAIGASGPSAATWIGELEDR